MKPHFLSIPRPQFILASNRSTRTAIPGRGGSRWMAGLAAVVLIGLGAGAALRAEGGSGGGGESELRELECGHGRVSLARAAAATGPGGSGRQYAPSREIDVVHLALDVTPDFAARTVAGTATLRFKPIARALAELRLDGVELRVTNVTSSAKVASWQATPEKVIVIFEPPIPADQEATVAVTYSATPKEGLYFRTPELGYPAGDAHLWTQGEPLEARHWFPSFDAPNEKFTSEVTCRVRPDMVVVSNGRLVGESTDAATGLKAVTWRQEKPHANYLIALVAGYLKKLEDRHRDIPLAFYTPASEIGFARESFKETREIMEFFEKEIGVPYPWAKYDQACVYDFGWGGMENTSLTVLNDYTLHTPEFEELRESRGLVAHEMAHQWFGDLVTCKDWSHVWLNEGFATYYTHLFEGHRDGPDELRYGLYQSAQGIYGEANDTNAIVRRDFQDPEEQFGFRAYPKGSWILHMLRHQLGEDLYRRCIKTYVERHQYGSVVTEDLSQVIEELSGRSFDQFFDQYVYHAHHPELGVSYSWDDRTKLARLSIRQEQKLSDKVLLFDVPLTVRFKGKFGTVERELRVREAAEDFYVPLPGAPTIVRCDPQVALLAKINFSAPTPMLLAQLEDSTDAMGRLIAAEQLSGKREALGALKKALQGDGFYPVRLAAASSLRAMQSEEAMRVLLDSTAQKDARVRRQVMNQIAGFFREEACTNLLRVVRQEKNPDLKGAAVARLGAWTLPGVREEILSALRSDSFHNVVEEAGLSAARSQDDATYLEPILEMLGRREGVLTTQVFAHGLRVLGWLARDEVRKDGIREFLLGRVSSPRQRVRTAALGALGDLGDPKAVAVLEKFALGRESVPEKTAAERALAAIRDKRKPSAEIGGIRTELLNVQRENRALRKDLDELRKKLDALSAKPTGPTAKEPEGKPGRPASRLIR